MTDVDRCTGSPARAPLDVARLQCALVDPGPWIEVAVSERTASTNTAAAADPRPWRVVATHEQTAGHGRHGRTWVSPPGTSVAMSMTVPLASTGAAAGWTSLMVGMAVRSALQDVCRERAAVVLKWPNDVLLEPAAAGGADGPPSLAECGCAMTVPPRGGKVAGVLCTVAAPGVAVAGVGVNVAVPLEELPVTTATSLSAVGVWADPTDVVAAIARATASVHTVATAGGTAALRTAYLQVCSTIGREVAVHLPDGSVAGGRAVDVDDSGALVVSSAGVERSYAAGDVVHVRPT